MPLFKSSPPPPPPPPVESSPTRSRSIFTRRNRSLDRSPSPPYDNHYDSNNNGTRTGGFFSHRRSSSSDESGRYGGAANGGDLRNDPSIRGARQKVSDAEAFEREADRALNQARAAVREAREHVRLLEREALDE